MELKSRTSMRWAWAKVILIHALPVLFVLFMIVFVPATIIYDRSHQEPLECTVQAAQVYEGSKRFVPFRVIIETEDCGDVSVARGVTAANEQEMAKSFEAGERYEFQIGTFELGWWGPLKQTVGGTIVAESYRKLDP